MFPKITSGHVDVQLTNVLLAYTNGEYVADQILPVVPNLAKETGKIPQMGNSHLRTYSSKRSLYDQSAHRVSFSFNNDNTYAIDYFDLSSYVPDRLQEQLDAPFDARNAAQMTVMQALMLEREVALAAIMTSTAVLTNNTTLSGSSQYTDPTSDPATDFDTARDSIQSKIGREANGMLMSRNVANALRRHPWFLEIAQSVIKGGTPTGKALSVEGLVEVLKSWYKLEYVVIGSAIKITSQQGQTETKGQVWGNDIVFFYRASSPSLFEPSFGYSFQLQGKQLQTRVRREPVEDKGDVVEVLWAYQDNILDVNAAYLIKSAI